MMPTHRRWRALGRGRLGWSVGLGLLLLGPGVARAEGTARAALDGLLTVDGDAVAGGGALSLALGYDAELSPLLLEPELRGSFGLVGGDFGGWWARALGGLRVGFAGPVEPCAFVRLGYGNTLVTRGDSSNGASGFAWQAGAALAYRPERWLTVGGEAFYDLFAFSAQDVGDLIHSVGLGATLGLWF